MDMDDWEESQPGNVSGPTALIEASRDGDVERVRSLLLDHATDVNELDNKGRRAIDLSFDGEHHEVSLLLLEADSVFPQPGALIPECGLNRDRRRNRWKDLINRNSKIRQFLFDRDEFHKKLKDEKKDIVEDLIRERESGSPCRIFVNTNGNSALYTAAMNSQHDTWALLKHYGFRYATEEEKEFMRDKDSHYNFIRALSKFNESPLGFHVEEMICKVVIAKVPGIDSSVHNQSLREYFWELDKEEPTSCLLRCLQHDRTLQICVDFNSKDISRMITVSNNNHIFGLTKFDLNKIYAVTMESEGFDSSDIVGNLAHELTHMALWHVFENGGLPFRDGDAAAKKKYEKIVEDVLSPPNLQKCEESIRRVAELPEKKNYELIVRVTEMISKYRKHGRENGYARLRKQAPALLKFFNQHVLPQMQEYANRSKPVKTELFTAQYDELIQVDRSDVESGLLRHGNLMVLNVSNLKLAISHLRRSLRDVTCVDWPRYERDQADFITAVRRGVYARLAIVCDVFRDNCRFCKAHTDTRNTCTSAKCFAKYFRKLETACILVVPNNDTIEMSFNYTWSDLADDTRTWLLEKELNFGGLNVTLSKVLKSLVGDEKLWREVIDPKFLSELIDEEKVVLGRDIFPSPPTEDSSALRKVIKEGSIIRSLRVSRMELNDSVFKMRPNDVFFVKDAEVVDLEGKEEFNLRCAMWNCEEVPEDIRCFALGKDDFKESDPSLIELSSTLRHPRHMGERLHFAHLFQLADGTLNHIHSINCRLSLRTPSKPVKTCCATYINALKGGPLIVADAAGSGKSFWVKMMASSIKNKYHAYWVDVIKLSACAHVYSQWGQSSFASTDQVVDSLLKMMDGGDSDLEKRFFKLYYESEEKCFIFFDGFDEVSQEYKESIALFLKELVDRTKIRVCVTTRCGEPPTLERCLSTLPYSFVPLNNGEQATMMVGEWKACLLKLSKEERHEKISAIISGLRSCNTFHNQQKISELVKQLESLRGRSEETLLDIDLSHLADEFMRMGKVREEGDEDFLEIPLHVWMWLTVAYEENFEMQESLSPYQLYKRFIELKTDLYCKEKISLPDNQAGNLMRAHYGNYEMLKSFAKSHILGDNSYQLSDVELHKALSMGLVSVERGSIVFVHETIGEFLFLLWLTDREGDEGIIKIWLENVLCCEKFKQFRQFVNVMFLYKYKENFGMESDITKCENSPVDHEPNKSKFLSGVKKCLYTCILEGHRGLLWYLMHLSNVFLQSVIFGTVDWGIRELEVVKELEKLEGKPFDPKKDCQNAIKFCGKLVSRTLSVKKSDIRRTKVDYLKVLTEMLRVSKGRRLDEKVNELVGKEGLNWMGIGNCHLWRDSSGKDALSDLFELLCSTVSPTILRTQLADKKCCKVVENATKYSWDTFINIVESMCESGEGDKLFLLGNNFFSAWLGVVEKCPSVEVERAWEYFMGKYNEAGRSKKKFLCRRNEGKTSALSAAFLNHRNPDVSTFVWELMRSEMDDEECKRFLKISNFSRMSKKRRTEYLSTYGFLSLLEELMRIKFLEPNEARHLLLPFGVNCKDIFEKCCSNKSLLALYTLQSILEKVCVQPGDMLLSLKNHYVSMISLCFQNRCKSGAEQDILMEKIGKDFEDMRPSLDSIQFLEKDSEGGLCHLSGKLKRIDMKAFLVLFNRQVQLEGKILGNDLLISRFKSQCVNMYGKLPCHESKDGDCISKTKAYSMAYIFGVLGNYLTRDELSECLMDININHDTKAVLKLSHGLAISDGECIIRYSNEL